jgi:hypothetical protein
MTGRYAMNTNPSTWPGPDDVDVIQAQERFEESSAFDSDLRAWMVNDDDVVAYATNRFVTTDEYDKAFEAWVAGGGR